MKDEVAKVKSPVQGKEKSARGQRQSSQHVEGQYLTQNRLKGGNSRKLVDENLVLVPCRWSNTGWKYTQADPAKTQFFSSPNRVNSFGFTQQNLPRRQVADPRRRRFHQSVEPGQGFYSNPGESEFQTSYGRFFNPNNLSEMKGWKQKFNNAEFGASKDKKRQEELIQWAGGLHQRSDFNKRRDQLGQWTEVFFHH